MRLQTLIFAWVYYLLFVSNVNGQQAEFETSFYFEDSVGNRDTIIIGADTSADLLVNTHLGEILLTNPWDDQFEVRVTTYENYHFHKFFGDTLYLFNKKITDLSNVPECGYAPSVIFLFYTRNHPVTVTWDTTLWSVHNNDCYLDGSFFHHSEEIFEPGWWTSFDWSYACLGIRNYYQMDTTHSDPYTGIIDSVNGVGMEFIYGLHLTAVEIENPISPCQFKVSIDSPNKYIESKFEVYPNPATGYISICLYNGLFQFSESPILSIRNLQGIEVIKHRNLTDDQISIHDLPNGIYVASLIDKQRQIVSSQKFIVINSN